MTDILFAIRLFLFIVFIMVMKILIFFCKHSMPPGLIRSGTLPTVTNNTPSAPLNSASTKPLYATMRSSYTPKPSSTREILLLFAVQYAWLIRKTRMCCACCLIVVISFMSSVLTRGYSNMLRARVSELASCWDGSFSGAVLKRSYSIHKTLTCGNKINYHIRISSFFGNEVVASPPLRDSFKHEKSGFEARAKVPTFCSWRSLSCIHILY